MRVRLGWIGALFAAAALAGWGAGCEDDPHDLDYLKDAGGHAHDAGDHEHDGDEDAG